MPEQPPWSDEKPAGLDAAFLEELASLGRLDLEFEGTTYLLEEGHTGQELVWMEGRLELQLSEDQLEIFMDGGFATPWPERQPISGTLLQNPDGIEVEVPLIDFSTSLNVNQLCHLVQCQCQGAVDQLFHLSQCQLRQLLHDGCSLRWLGLSCA